LEKLLEVADRKCHSISSIVSGVPIIFLHGFSYSSEIWQQIGVTDLLIQKRIPFLAIDMPYGVRSKCLPKTQSLRQNLNVVEQAIQTVFGSLLPILVGASIGANIALHYATNFPVKGLVLIAPGRALEPELLHLYSKFTFPTTIIWGSEDNIVAGETMRTLAQKLPKAKLIVYEGAGHSAYKDQPEHFKHDLLEFYAKAE
jgi:pimeloyl-ACP methyl ester carboxylesterase